MSVLLGIDVGGTKIAGGLMDARTGAILLHARVATHAPDGGKAVLARALALARELVSEAQAQNIPAPVGVGVGAGGQIDARRGVVVSATDILPGWAGTPLRAAFEDVVHLPTSVDNDVNALAVGETRWGAGRGCADLLFLALGTGVGGAIVSGGCLHRGAHGGGGELGHLLVDTEDAENDNDGLLEQKTNGAALVHFYRACGGDGDKDGPAISRAAHNGEPTALAAAEIMGNWLGVGLVSLANVFDPARIIIGGGVAQALGELLLEPARRVLDKRGLPHVRATPIVCAALGADASVIGAASLALGEPREPKS